MTESRAKMLAQASKNLADGFWDYGRGLLEFNRLPPKHGTLQPPRRLPLLPNSGDPARDNAPIMHSYAEWEPAVSNMFPMVCILRRRVMHVSGAA